MPGETDATDATVGLPALYEALLDVAARHTLDALAIAVTDPALGVQVFAVGDAPAGTVAWCQARESSWAALPPPPEELPELATLRSLALTALRLGTIDPDGDPMTALEIAIRRLPGITAVTRQEGVLRIVVARDAEGDVLAQVTASRAAPAPIIVVETPRTDGPEDRIAPAGPSPTDAGRVELVAVRTEPERGELEVHLRFDDRRAVGRGPLGLAGTAASDATLSALRDVGVEIPARVGWVRTFDTLPDRRFLVGVSLELSGEETLYGIATGASPIEAAARATLGACNRRIGRNSLPA